MGIQINGNNDTISAADGGIVISGSQIDNANLVLSENLKVSGIGTFGNGLRVTGGSVGIGTNNPAANFKLDVNGDLSLGEFGGTDNSYIDQKQNGHLNIINSGILANTGSVRINKFNTIGESTTYFRDFIVYDGKNNIIQFVDGSSGNVGIGTDNPSAKLDVEDNAASGYIAEFRQKNSSNLGTILIDSPTDSASRTVSLEMSRANTLQWAIGQAYNDTNNSFHIATSSLQGGNTGAKLTIDKTSGNVGIATASPGAKLHVYGNAVGFVTTLTDGATITPNFASANNFTVTLGGTRTLANPTGLVPGQSGFISIVQDGTGSRTLSWGSFWDFPSATPPTLTTTANGVDVVAYYVRTTTSIAADTIIGIGTL